MAGNETVAAATLGLSISTRFEQDAALLAAVRWWRSKTSRHGRQAPLLDVRLDEHEAGLAEIDVHRAGSVGADRGEEVLGFEAVGYVIEFLAVACEEDRAGARAIADANDVALDVGRAIRSRREGLVVPARTRGGIGYGRFVPAYVNKLGVEYQRKTGESMEKGNTR